MWEIVVGETKRKMVRGIRSGRRKCNDARKLSRVAKASVYVKGCDVSSLVMRTRVYWQFKV